MLRQRSQTTSASAPGRGRRPSVRRGSGRAVSVALVGAVLVVPTATASAAVPASVSVSVFHDLDHDGRREPGDIPLANRTVKLLSSAGAPLSTAHTDVNGSVAFPAEAGTAYQVTVVPLSPWIATAPVSGTTVLTTIPVTTAVDGAPTAVAVGHYNTVDLTPPPVPVPTPGGSPAPTTPFLVTIDDESGAVVRYTLDGTAPTASRGMVYATPIRISMDHVLQAVAVDPAGNVSAIARVSYDLPWTGRSAVLTPSAWAVTSGGTPRGGTAETVADDGRELAVGSVTVGTRKKVDVTATVAVPADLRAAAAVSVAVSQRTTMRGTKVRAQYLDTSAVPNVWRALITQTQSLDEAKVEVDLGTATKLVDASGNLTVRLIADNAWPFDLAVDQMAVTVVNRR